MSNRIRYTETDKPSILRSVKAFQHPTNNLARFIVFLNLEKLAYKISDELTGEVLTHGEATNLNSLKKVAKNALVDLGVEGFQKEERAKRKQV
jgi:hypothetical protein